MEWGRDFGSLMDAGAQDKLRLEIEEAITRHECVSTQEPRAFFDTASIIYK